jgi:peptidoglycan L-alanyl-D-glutamate endopeptidase CwlK
MLARIFALFQRRPVEAPQAPAVTQAPQATAGEGAATSPAVPVHAVGDPLPAIDTLKGAAVGLTPRDIARLAGVHPDLVRVVVRARAAEAFTVLEGLRSPERQATLLAQGASKTMKSRHLTGHAVDLGPVPLDWQDKPAFRRMAAAMKRAADAEGVALVWGGDWRSFYDGPHFELDRRKYPA